MRKLLCLLLIVEAALGQGITRLPAEWEPHERTFLCFPGSEEIWTEELLPEVKKDVARIANAIAEYEPVVMLVHPEDMEEAQELLDPRVEVVSMLLDDLWARDTLPVFVQKSDNDTKQTIGVIFNFNGWGNKQDHVNDAKVAERVVSMYNIEGAVANIVAEGGSFETDGAGTLLVTESALVNTNRNLQSKAVIEAELKRRLGVRKVIWFTGVKDQDITDAHVDGLVKFVGPHTVILNRAFPGSEPDDFSRSSDEAYEILQNTKDANGNSFKIIPLYEPDPDKIIYKGNETTFLSSYVNFYIGNGFVLLPKFGDEYADAEAKSTLLEFFPERKILSIPISALASGGGGIHCATHDQPAVIHTSK